MVGGGGAWLLLLEPWRLSRRADPGAGVGWGPPASPTRGLQAPRLPAAPAESKLEKNEEAALLSWEIYLKESYLQSQQHQQKQRPEQKIQDIGNKYGRPGRPTGRETPAVPSCSGDMAHLEGARAPLPGAGSLCPRADPWLPASDGWTPPGGEEGEGCPCTSSRADP